MPRIAYIAKNLQPAKLAVIDQCNAIITEYDAQGFSLTLRQLYYQMVSRDLIPNTQRSYKNLGTAVNDGRLIGLIDWNAIVDRTRNLQQNSHWTDPGDIIDSAAKNYALDKWASQEFYPEVWIEKDALIGVIEDVCNLWDVPFFSCRGYTSQSEVWAAAQRLHRHAKTGQTPLIIHLGDHDPSGIDMTRDIRDRLELFTGRSLKVDRLALNMDQVEQYGPPPNPAKMTDSRFQAYMAEYGDESWELDALEPSVMANLIESSIKAFLDEEAWDAVCDQEREEKRKLEAAAENWEEISEGL